MKADPVILVLVLLLFSFTVTGQTLADPPRASNPALEMAVDKISQDLDKVSKSLDTFNLRLNEFLQNLNKYKGVQLSESQQRILFAYEVLNQSEQLSATLRKSLLETAEREATLKRRLQQIEFDLRPENIDRSLQTAGTTKLDEARDNQRRKLDAERDILQTALREIETGKFQITENLRYSQSFANSFRTILFAQIKSEMGKDAVR